MTFTLRGNPDRYVWKKWLRFLAGVARLFSFRLNIRDGKTNYAFRPKSRMEIFRYTTFFSKEEGTLAWIRDNAKEGSVFYDIGANIGLYSLYAARAAKGVKVYSFEPHKFNFATLLENIFLNGLETDIHPMSLGLGEETGLFHLNYSSMESGASMSQLGHNNLSEDRTFTPKLAELMHSISLDSLVDSGKIPAPNLIKIDVDGNELLILKGMRGLLNSDRGPASLQVEINPGQRTDVVKLMEDCGYKLDHSHFTKGGKKQFEKDPSYDTVPHNAVFTKG